MDIDTIIKTLEEDSDIKSLVVTIKPYLTVIAREGESLFVNFVTYAVAGKWSELDIAVWDKMTEEERDSLSDTILEDARKTVDSLYALEKSSKAVLYQVVTTLLLAIIKGTMESKLEDCLGAE